MYLKPLIKFKLFKHNDNVNYFMNLHLFINSAIFWIIKFVHTFEAHCRWINVRSKPGDEVFYRGATNEDQPMCVQHPNVRVAQRGVAR